jgi:hypothetical protein
MSFILGLIVTVVVVIAVPVMIFGFVISVINGASEK